MNATTLSSTKVPLVSGPSTRSLCWRAARALVCAVALAVSLVAATPASAAPRRAPRSMQPAVATTTSVAVVRVLLPAVSRKWPLERFLSILGHPLLVTADAADPRTRWLTHTRHDRRLVVEVVGQEVTAVLLTVRTKAADAYDFALAAISDVLGRPQRAGAHDACWLGEEVDVRLAGWRGEFNLEVRAR